MTPHLRIAVAVALLLFALVELLWFLALVAAPSHVHAMAEHGLLGLLAGLAGFALWRRLAWAPAAILGFGFAFAIVSLIDAIVLGIRPWLFAVLIAAAAVLAALALASWAKQEARGPT